MSGVGRNSENLKPNTYSKLLPEFRNSLPIEITMWGKGLSEVIQMLREIPSYESALVRILGYETPENIPSHLGELLSAPQTSRLIRLKQAIRAFRSLADAGYSELSDLQNSISNSYDAIGKIIDNHGRGRPSMPPKLCGPYHPNSLFDKLKENDLPTRKGARPLPSFLTTACTGYLTLKINNQDINIPYVATPVRYLDADLGEKSKMDSDPKMHPMLAQFLKDAFYSHLPLLLNALFKNGNVTLFTSPNLSHPDGNWDRWLSEKIPARDTSDEIDFLRYSENILQGIPHEVTLLLKDENNNPKEVNFKYTVNTTSTNPLNSRNGVNWLKDNNCLISHLRHILHQEVFVLQEFGGVLGKVYDPYEEQLTAMLREWRDGKTPEFISCAESNISDIVPSDLEKIATSIFVQYSSGDTHLKYLAYLFGHHSSPQIQDNPNQPLLLLTTEDLVDLLRADSGSTIITEVSVLDFEYIPMPQPSK